MDQVQNAFTLRLPTLLNLLSSISSTKLKGWLFSNKGVKLALKIKEKLLGNSDNIFINLLVIIKNSKLNIILFKVWWKVFIQNNINLTMIIPEWSPTFTWFSKEIFVLNPKVNKSASNLVQSICSLYYYA